MHKLKPSLQPDVKSYALLLQAGKSAQERWCIGVLSRWILRVCHGVLENLFGFMSLLLALKADKLNTAAEIVLRAPVGRHVKDSRYFPALLQGMNVETQLSTFALTKLAALIEQVNVESEQKQVSLCVW